MIYIVISSFEATVHDIRRYYKVLVGAFTDRVKAEQVAKDYQAEIYPVKYLDEILRPLSSNFGIYSKKEFDEWKEKITSGEYQQVIYHDVLD